VITGAPAALPAAKSDGLGTSRLGVIRPRFHVLHALHGEQL
jgi:hypothetical protein